jgi:hypothetical protein
MIVPGSGRGLGFHRSGCTGAFVSPIPEATCTYAPRGRHPGGSPGVWRAVVFFPFPQNAVARPPPTPFLRGTWSSLQRAPGGRVGRCNRFRLYSGGASCDPLVCGETSSFCLLARGVICTASDRSGSGRVPIPMRKHDLQLVEGHPGDPNFFAERRGRFELGAVEI